MGEQRAKYILLDTAIGLTVKRNVFALGLANTSTATKVLRGSLLEELPKAKQPQRSNKIALTGIDCKSLRLECHITILTRLSDEDVDFLLAISSPEERYQTLQTGLDFGRQISLGSKVSVSVKGVSSYLPGVVSYKGELPSNSGTMFGVELTVSMSAFINF